MIDFDIVSE